MGAIEQSDEFHNVTTLNTSQNLPFSGVAVLDLIGVPAMAEQRLAVARRQTIQETLQEYCDIILDDATGVTWDLYRPDQKDKLELKVRLAMWAESVSVNEDSGEVRNSLS